ncbi:hypothetical protein EN827_11040 [Mesorhizobium sp. M1D.F.Ca.ET.184.01.1.1]|nr:hypothetical protein EN874_011050 [Mesorhizobium sp. M1D.F.Ca.ET.231.01.1.1]TGP35499.1 hypothetical protein EN877_11045 [Mesorhizobium sp. M1D.F.Ca.ET.234.01.1.1]TGS49522.1 hypothetical protein EN827_11040 [Mesorhizobium sp. M1D.F.Ca.ET.184.01.1.1]TGS63720.1 hypothetical protein EN826_011040 [Mesorhizobium sp. M1D.F.Ca.ET.183.01.1.1]
MGCDPSRPPLSCRTSPPQGGRSDVIMAFANLRGCRISGAQKQPISPLVGEMSGRTEGGRCPADVSDFLRSTAPAAAAK